MSRSKWIYKDNLACDFMPMDVCHVLLGRPWKFDRNVVVDGRRNTYTFEKHGNKIHSYHWVFT